MIIQYSMQDGGIYEDSATPIQSDGVYEFIVSVTDVGQFLTTAKVSVGDYAMGGKALPIVFLPDGATSLFFGLLSVSSSGAISISFYTADGSAAGAAADSILYKKIR